MKTSLGAPLAQTGRFVREARDELKKVAWPTREQTTRYTIVVVIASVATGFIIGAVDYILSLIIEQLVL